MVLLLPHRLSPEAIKAELERIEALYGKLTPELVVQESADLNSVLYAVFEHDPAKGLLEYQIEQARQLIRSVRVEITTTVKKVTTVGYIKDPDVRATEQGYVGMVALLTQEERARAVIDKEVDRVAALISRTRSIAEALDLLDETNALLRELLR